MSVNETLAQRQNTHGDFNQGAMLVQSLNRVVRSGINYPQLCDAHLEALEMIMHKVGRILTGTADFADHWRDIAGYAKRGEELCSDYDGEKA